MKLGKIEARMLFQLSLPTEGQTDGYGDKGESCLWACHRAMHCFHPEKKVHSEAATEQDKILSRLSASKLLCKISTLCNISVLSNSATVYVMQTVSIVSTVSTVSAVYSAVLPPSLMVFYNGHKFYQAGFSFVYFL